MLCCTCVSHSYSWWRWYFQGPWVSFVVIERGSKELLERLVSHERTAYLSFFDLFLTLFLIMAILSKGCKPNNFRLYNSLKLDFTNIWGLHSNFAGYKSFLKSKSSDILALCETNLDDSLDSVIFSVMVYVLLIWKDSFTHMHGLAVYVKEGYTFAWDLSLENSVDSYLCFQLALLHSLSYVFFFYPLLHLHARFLMLFHLSSYFI